MILFKKLYSKLVLMAGFTVSGREWIANGFISSLISFVTFQVYANMTRFQWAYPSGTEDVINQWIAGPTMVLATVKAVLRGTNYHAKMLLVESSPLLAGMWGATRACPCSRHTKQCVLSSKQTVGRRDVLISLCKRR